MNLKKANITLITIVGLLLFVAVLVLIKCLFSDVKGFEWGSVSDWFSTFGTLGTLWIAYVALRKAPEWMSQKHYDIAYNTIESAVFHDLAKVRSASMHLKNKIFYFSKNMNNIVLLDEKSSIFISETLERIGQNIDEYHQITYSIINRLKSISRTEYDLTNYTKDLIETLLTTVNDYNKIYNDIYFVTDEIEGNFYHNEYQKDTFKKKTHELQMAAIKINTSLNDKINLVFTQNKQIKDFIIRKCP